MSLNAFENLKSLSQLKEHDIVFLVYEKNGCPWCVQYKNELEDEIIQKYKEDVQFFKVKKGSKIFTRLRKEMGYEVIIYPMTYILKKDTNRELKLIDEIYGYQTGDYIEDIFKNKLFIK